MLSPTGDDVMQTKTTATRSRSWRKRWSLFYQDASGTPDDEVLERAFKTDDEAMAWVEAHFVVPLWLEEHDQLVRNDGRVVVDNVQRHDI